MTKPCDTEDEFIPLTPEQKEARVLNFDAWRLRRLLSNQLSHDLANAFRSTEAAGKHDPDDGSAA